MVDLETELPFREGGPIRRMGYNAKVADGPRAEAMPQLRRFLNSKVGQEWDLVYLLICDKAKYSAVPDWTRDRVNVMVEFDCIERDGRIYDAKGDVVESWGRPEFYTCGGILKRAPQRPKYVRSERVMPTEGVNHYEVNGAFFEVYFRKFFGTTDRYHRLPTRTEFDVLTKTSLTWRESELRYGGLISWKKRQLSKREIRRLGLREETQMILNNENYCATVIRIKSTVKLDGLDNLVGVPLFGFNALVPKDYDLDQLYVFFTAESQLSDRYCFENNLFDKADLNKDKTQKGYINNKRRVRAVKLRGNVSSALIMPISSLGYLGDISHLKEGDMFNVLADEEVCKKYIIRTPQSSGPKSTKIKTRQLFNSKLFPEHIDTSNWGRNHSSINDDAYIIVSQKLHGTSFRLTHQKMIQFPKWLVRLWNKGFGNWKIVKFLEKLFRKSDYQLIAGSRTVVKIRDSDQVGFYCSDLWNQALDKIGHLIPKNWVIYGELIGWSNNSPIQKGYTYDQKTGCFDIYVYRIAVVNEDGISVDLPYDGMKKWCAENGVKICPEMWRGHKKDFNYEAFMDMRYADHGYSQCLHLSDPKTVDEGVVIRIDNGLTPSLYKAKSPMFLGHETKQLDDGVVSIEDEESLNGP